MLRLWPSPSDQDVDDESVGDTLSSLDRDTSQNRPWLMTNMVTSLDGAATRTGRSGGLGGDGDRRMFHLLRRLPDAIVVGAGTVRAERYRPVTASARNGRPPRLVITSARLELDLTLPCLADADDEHRALVVTVASADPERRRAIEPLAEVVVAGETMIESAALLALLGDRGHEVVLCEGGPTLLGQLMTNGLVDEWFVTIAGLAIAGTAPRITQATSEVEERLSMRTTFSDGRDLFLSYVRDDQPAAT